MGGILVTGGTSALGRVLYEKLRDAGQEVRALSRRPRASDGPSTTWAVEDLRKNDGIADAMNTIVHCATGRRDVDASANLVAAGKRVGANAYLIYISIVGIEEIPLFYYRSKLKVEHLVQESGLPWTVLRATQFHDLVAGMFSAQRHLPVLLAPAFSFQPIDTHDVAGRLTELAFADPVGRAPDIAAAKFVRRPNLPNSQFEWKVLAHMRTKVSSRAETAATALAQPAEGRRAIWR